MDNAYEIETDSIRWYLKQTGIGPLLTKEEEIEFAYLIQEGSDEARQKMISSNLRLVTNQAKKYATYIQSLTLLDLTQEGNLGLIRAVEKYNPELGFRLSTHASWWTKQATIRAILVLDKAICLSVHFCEDIQKVKRATHEIAQQDDIITPEKSEDIAGFSKGKIEEILTNMNHTISLEIPVGEEATLGGFVEGTLTPSIEEQAMENAMQGKISRQMECLGLREQTILALRFGLNGQNPRTSEEVGKQIGVTGEKIRQIEMKALRRLRHPNKSRYPREFVLEQTEGGEIQRS